MVDKDPSRTPADQPVAGGATRTEPGDPGRTGGTHREPRAGTRRWAPRGRGLRTARRQAVGLLAALVSIITTVVVLILAVHILFAVFEANTGNELVAWVGDRARDLAWQFKDVFEPEDPKVSVAVNHGLAAVVYLVIGRIVVALIRRAA
ncbi:hypothetical protein GCM10009678_72710 [Actinomadura kijaniata]|uniref:Uncharacterized protein n=1 Tax=Actinomadura namibiensis TaxID=182080 RepID=A0A7W3QSL3_ACTNM|nr:hypothetical protein [Actinomadura namibiensis]MBA8957523.1 hypothetical protein [Actinomadura namibiensis]